MCVCVCGICPEYGIVKTNGCEGLCILMSLGRNTVKGIVLFLRIAWGLVGTEEIQRRFELRERRELAMIGIGIRHFE